MKYFIAHLLSGNVQRYHEALTRQLSERFAIVPLHEKVPPHLTVKVPFEADDGRIADVERIVRSFARGHAAVPLTLGGFGHFGFRTIYLDTLESRGATIMVRDLIRVIRENLLWLPRPPLEGNKLHASVARFLSRRQFRRVWRALRETRPRFRTQFDNLAILKQDRKVWKVHTFIPLQGATDASWYTVEAWQASQWT